MVEAIEPVSGKKKKRVYNPFLVVPPPLIPLWPGVSIPDALVGALLESASRVVETTNENFHWQKKKHEEGKSDDELRARIRKAHRRQENKNLSNHRVVNIQ